MRARLFATCSNQKIKRLRSNVREGGPIARRAESHEGRMRIGHYQVCAIDSLNGISQAAHAYGKQKRHESRSKQYSSHLHRQLKQSSQQWLWRPNFFLPVTPARTGAPEMPTQPVDYIRTEEEPVASEQSLRTACYQADITL